MMLVAAPLFLTETRKPGEPHSTHWTQSLSFSSAEAHMHATGSIQLNNPSFNIQSIGMMCTVTHPA